MTRETPGAGWRFDPPPPVLCKYRSLAPGARDFTRDIIVNSRLADREIPVEFLEAKPDPQRFRLDVSPL